MLRPWMVPSDLAPSDRKSLERDWSEMDLRSIQSVNEAAFPMAFAAFWEEFGALGEMESAEVLRRRLERNGQLLSHGCRLFYELMFLSAAGDFAGACDHTVILPGGTNQAIVHLSHILVAPAWRQSGLAGWLRTFPLQAARRCSPKNSAITIAGEMEHFDPGNPATLIRLKAYEKAGYLKVDPARVPYLQPDFRTPMEIDASDGPQPLPLTLIIRRVGREAETTISGRELLELVRALYEMYATDFRERDMVPVWANLEKFPPADESIALLPPASSLPA